MIHERNRCVNYRAANSPVHQVRRIHYLGNRRYDPRHTDFHRDSSDPMATFPHDTNTDILVLRRCLIMSVLSTIWHILSTVVAWMIMLILNGMLWVFVLLVLLLTIAVIVDHFKPNSRASDDVIAIGLPVMGISLIVLATLCIEGTFRIIPLFWWPLWRSKNKKPRCVRTAARLFFYS